MSLNKKEIHVVPYNPVWPIFFEEEANLIRQTLGADLLEIHHVGSTSVPGLSAKPRIDIIAAVKNPENIIQKLQSLGYKYAGEYNIPFHFGFSKRGEREFNLHVYEIGSSEIELNIMFRDYLRSYPEAVEEYAHLKADLLTKESSFVKNNSMLRGYNLGKYKFIKTILEKAGFDKLRMHYCTHYEELEKAKQYRKAYFNPESEDPYLNTFNDPNHIHLIFYQGVKIIGYAHVHLKPNHIATLLIFVIDKEIKNPVLNDYFLGQIKKLMLVKNLLSDTKEK